MARLVAHGSLPTHFQLELFDRYAKAVDQNQEKLEAAKVAREIFKILRHAAPLLRSLRNIVAALADVLQIDHDDREILVARDRAKELERVAELLFSDARCTMEFHRAEKAEECAESSVTLSKMASRLNLLAGFFLPLVAMGGLMGMNVDPPKAVQGAFWVILFGGLCIGGVLSWLVGRRDKP
jgi:Mg2+ and Co2+ transporter CorA